MMTTTHSQVLYFETLTAQHPVPARPNPVGITTDNCAISCCDLVLLRCPVQVTVRVTGWARTAAHIQALYQLISALCTLVSFEIVQWWD